MGSLVLSTGAIYNSYCYMVIPLKRDSLLDLLVNAIKSGLHLSWRTKKYLCAQIVHCVHYLHKNRQMAHLDLKGDNLVFNEDFSLSLIDFGMAELIEDELDDQTKMTPKYRAPEIESDLKYSPGPADIFGVGVCLFMVMFQAPPFKNNFCLKNMNYIRYSDGENLRFFRSCGIDMDAVPETAPFTTIMRTFNRNPLLRPTIEELYALPFFQVHQADASVIAELGSLLSAAI
jgi:serine/threonine protein kinase